MRCPSALRTDSMRNDEPPRASVRRTLQDLYRTAEARLRRHFRLVRHPTEEPRSRRVAPVERRGVGRDQAISSKRSPLQPQTGQASGASPMTVWPQIGQTRTIVAARSVPIADFPILRVVERFPFGLNRM